MSTEPTKSFEKSLKNTAEEVMDRASDVASQIKTGANQAKQAVSNVLQEKANAIPYGDKISQFTSSVAEGVGNTAGYLRDADFKKMGKDAMNVCRRYPTQSIVAALALGFLIGRTRRS